MKMKTILQWLGSLVVWGWFVFQVDAAVLVSTNSSWTYHKGATEASTPIEAWRGWGFSDSGWSVGTAPFHYNYGVTGGTPIDDMRQTSTQSGYLCLFLRQRFNINDLAGVGNLTLQAVCDDGFVAWINGVEVARYNLPTGAITISSRASAAVPEPPPLNDYPLPSPGSYLQQGENVICIQLFNNSPTSSDLLFYLALVSSEPDLTPPTIQTVTPAPGTVSNLSAIQVSFSEPVQGVDLDDLLINGEPLTELVGGGAEYVFTFAQPPYGSVNVSWDPGHEITDFGSPANTFDHTAGGASWDYVLVDDSPPVVVSRVPPTGVTVRLLDQIQLTFSEAVFGLEAADLMVNGRAATGMSGSSPGPVLFTFPAVAAGPAQLSWRTGHGITDRASPPNPFLAEPWSYTVDPDFLSSAIRINEFLASNRDDAGLRDEDGELQDWIEIHNQSDAPVSLAGWSLTDNVNEPRKWTFPAVSVAPNGYLLVFASAKDRRPVNGELHTNFRLGVTGEYLGLYNHESPAVTVTEFLPTFPEQRNDYSFGLDADGFWRHFATPSPGGANGSSALSGVAPRPHFAVPRGYFDSPFTLVLTTPLAGSTVRYTTDGREPTASQGLVYSAPIAINQSTVVRAAVFKQGFLPSTTTTHSYLFRDSVLSQPAAPSGFPSQWITQGGTSVPGDYAIDARIVNDPQYAERIQESLSTLPILSVSTDVDNLFSRQTGIYANPQGTGPAWERPVSAEFIFHDGRDSKQVDAGFRIQGGTSREPTKTSKHSLRLLFKGDYGPSKLDLDFLPGTAVNSFDTLLLDAGLNYVWHYGGGSSPETQRGRAKYVEDQYASDLQNDMGGNAPHGLWFHVFLNGLYWGIHGVHERPDETFAADYYGGEPEEYDVLKNTTGFSVIAGDVNAWNTLLGLANSGLANSSQYEQLQQYLDVPAFIDYMIMNFFVGNTDWPHHNWYVVRKRDATGRFRLPSWDAEHILKSTSDNRTGVNNGDTPAQLYDQLRLHNAEFRLLFADRIHRHFFNGGTLYADPAHPVWDPLYPGRNRPADLYQRRVQEVDVAMVLESARWGDTERPADPYERDVEFEAELDWLMTDYFPVRSAEVLDQFKTIGLYPTGAVAPTFGQHGGVVSAGFSLSMTAPAGTIYYTTNGVDPRVPYSGAVQATAKTYTVPVSLNGEQVIKARTRNGSTWSALTEASFTVGSLGIPIRFTEIMYEPTGGSPYEFVELRNVGAATVNLSGFSLEGVDFVFATPTVLNSGQIVIIASDDSPSAFANRYPGVSVEGYFDGTLANEGERLALLDNQGNTVTSVTYGTRGGWPRSTPDRSHSIEVVDVRNDADAPANWLASTDPDGSPGYLPVRGAPGPVVLNEIMTHDLASGTNGLPAPDWIELHNTSGGTVDLSGWGLTDGSNPHKFVFGPDTEIEGDGYLLVWCDSDGAAPGIHADFSLDQDGETLQLWHPNGDRMDGLTYGLQLADLTSGRNPQQPDDWRLCRPTPGRVNELQAMASTDSLRFNEWMADAAAGEADWLELHNSEPNLPVDLGGLYVQVNDAVSQGRSLSFVSGGGFVRLWADEKPGAKHLDLRLPAAGGRLSLFDGLAVQVDQITYGPQTEDVSEGRLPDGSANIVSFTTTVSPGASNYLPSYTGPILNEVMAWNVAAVSDTQGRWTDWVELHNPGTVIAPVGGMAIEKGLDPNTAWVIPNGVVVPAQGYLVLSCDGRHPASDQATDDPLNTGFGLDREGDTLRLFNREGQVVDLLEFGPQSRDYALGRASGQWKLLTQPTPGHANAAPVALGTALDLRFNEWMADPGGGDDWVEIYNTGSTPIDLAGVSLTDDLSFTGMTTGDLGTLGFIGPMGHLRFTADGNPQKGWSHLDFQLDSAGDAVIMRTPTGQTIDTLFYGAQLTDVSEGRLPDGDASIVGFPTSASPGEANYLPSIAVRISEVLSHTDPPFEDAVEIRNESSDAMDLTGWYVSDDVHNLKKYQLPQGFIIPPQGTRVVYEYQLNGGAGSIVPFTFNSAFGDRVCLSASDAQGQLAGMGDRVEFGAAANGVSHGLFPTSIGDQFVPLESLTFGVDNPNSLAEFRGGGGAPNSGALVGPVIISEIMYHPLLDPLQAAESGTGEFVELMNISDVSLPLYDPQHRTNRWRLGGGIDFEFSEEIVVPALGLVLVVPFDPATDTLALADFQARYAVNDNAILCGPYEGRLGNGGDSVALYRPDTPQAPTDPDAGYVPYLLVERVSFTDQAPWPVLGDGLGASLQRSALVGYGNEPLHWTAATPTVGSRNNSAGGDNTAPTLEPIMDRTIEEGTTLAFTVTAMDSDIPANQLTYQLMQPPTFASMDPGNGRFTWTPGETQGPGEYSIAVRVTDNGSPPLSAEQSFTVTVTESNTAPTLPVVPDQNVMENSLWVLLLEGSDSDYPSNVIRYSLVSAPPGVQVDALTGRLSWIPLESQGPGPYSIEVALTDNAAVPLSSTQRFNVFVVEENSPPAIRPIPPQNVVGGDRLSLLIRTTDADVPSNVFSFDLVDGPVGAQIEATTGLFEWDSPMVTEVTAQTITVRVMDDGSPSLGDTVSFTVTVFPEEILAVTVRIIESNGVILVWPHVPGRTYQVEYKETLADLQWKPLEVPVVVAGSEASVLDPEWESVAYRFYRVVELL